MQAVLHGDNHYGTARRNLEDSSISFAHHFVLGIVKYEYMIRLGENRENPNS